MSQQPGEPIDFEAEGLLEGLQGERRAERLALLQQLAAEGMPLSELRRTTASGTVVFLPADRVIVGPERYTAAQVAELAGVELDFLAAVRRAMGLPAPEPDEALYTEAELESARMIHVARSAGISDEEVLALLRVLGRGLSQAAETLRALPLKLVLRPGMSERDLAGRYAQAAAQLYPLLDPLLSNLLALHLRNATENEVVSALERGGGQLPGAREVAVCFADLVGFTRLGEEVPPDELGRLAVRLESLATDVAQPPVRLVKTIGDAAMLASVEAEPLLAATLALIDAADAEGEDFPQLRAGAALGAALPRAGDWFGRPVNLASRITQIARPGSVLVERGVRDSTREAFRFSYAGERRLRGVREPARLFRARRLPAERERRPAAPHHRRLCPADDNPRPAAPHDPKSFPDDLRLPDAPGGLAGGPQVVELHRVLVGVHALPEALVPVRAQLAVGGELLQRLALEHAVERYALEHALLEAEEATVDPVLGAGLLAEVGHPALAVELGDPELQRGLHDGHRGERPVGAVAGEQRAEIDVGEPVGVGGAEGPDAGELRGEQPDPPARGSVLAGVGAAHLHAARPRGAPRVGVDQLALVAGCEHEAAEPLGGVEPDHVAHDRLAADLDERLGDLAGALAQACSAPAAEDHHRRHRIDVPRVGRHRATVPGAEGSRARGAAPGRIPLSRRQPATRSSTSAGTSKFACTSPTSSLSSSTSISFISRAAWDSSIGTRLEGR
jgi:adenylate cyclase